MTELALHILDIVQNSVSAKASVIQISIIESIAENKLAINIEDNGIGMNEAIVAKVLDPFYTTRTTRDVGLGLPLFKMAVTLCNGFFDIESLALFTHGFNDDVNMRMRLVGMKRHDVAILQRKLFTAEISDSSKDLIRRRPGGHREHQLMDQLWRRTAAGGGETGLAPVLVQVEVPVL